MPITKSTGVTDTERLLADLCEKTFLRLWSYPNPRRDDGDELCDLLAVFDEHVFIFFDREGRHFSNEGNDPQLAWDRWKRDVVDKQIKSTRGAERYLRSGRAIFLDAKCKVPFPIDVPRDRMIVHKIVVAHGAADACKNFSDENVTGSLAVGYSAEQAPFEFPFSVQLERDDPVHVLDSHSLPILFSELDTIVDLVGYLEAKRDAIKKYDLLLCCGEEDMLANYFWNFDQESNKHFIGVKEPGINSLWISEGEWAGLLERDEYKAKKKADESSYLWDDIIQRTCQNALDGTLLGEANLLKGKSAIHEMAREPRFMRRGLSDNMLRVIEQFPDKPDRILRHVAFMPSFYKEKGYVFLQLRVLGESDANEQYRERRRALLEIACASAKNKFPELTTVVGIAIDAPKYNSRTAEDFLLLDCSEWTDEMRSLYEEKNKDLRFFGTSSLQERREKLQNFPG
jgi:hypothetical protein